MPSPSGITTIEVAIKNEKFTYCRSQIVYDSCSPCAYDKQRLQLHVFLDGHVYLFISILGSQQHYLKPGYIIQLIAFQWNTPSSPDPSLLVK